MRDTHALANRIHEALTSISDNYDNTLEPARRAAESHAVSSMVNPPLPVSAITLDARNDTCNVLDHWYIHIRTTRKLKVGIERWDVTTLTEFLDTHRDWLADTPDGPRATAQLEHCSLHLKEIAQDNAPHRFKVGACPGTTNGQPCPGTVRATVRSDDDMLPSELACDATPRHTWPAGEWRVLERRLHRNEKAARNATLTRASTLDIAAARRLLAAINTPTSPSTGG